MNDITILITNGDVVFNGRPFNNYHVSPTTIDVNDKTMNKNRCNIFLCRFNGPLATFRVIYVYAVN